MADQAAPQSTAGVGVVAGHGHGHGTGASTSNNISTTSTSAAAANPSASGSKPTDPQAVEMSVLDSTQRTTTGAGSQSGLLNDVNIPESSPIDTSFPVSSSTDMPTVGSENTRPGGNNVLVSTSSKSNDPLSDSSNGAMPPPVTRLDSESIGPSTGEAPIAPVVSSGNEAGPALLITLLLGSGARHPYKIDMKYLTKRNVEVTGVTEAGQKDPYSISVYTLKELILREWREEWEAQPSSPSSIRLIYFGRLLDDKTPLKDCRFYENQANVVHMTVRPQDIVDEEDASKGKGMGRNGDGNESTAGCRCVIL